MCSSHNGIVAIITTSGGCSLLSYSIFWIVEPLLSSSVSTKLEIQFILTVRVASFSTSVAVIIQILREE